MKKLLVLLVLLVSGLGYSQDYEVWVPDHSKEIAAKKKMLMEQSRERAINYLKNIKLDTSLFEMSIFDEINRQRVLNHKPILKRGSVIQFDSTRIWADVQAQGGFVGHSAKYYPKDAYTEVSAGNFITEGLCENLTEKKVAEYMAKELVTQWMESPGHKNSILDSGFSIMSVGVSFKLDEKAAIMKIATTARGHKY
jgi:uncharacterized protein YkwD